MIECHRNTENRKLDHLIRQMLEHATVGRTSLQEDRAFHTEPLAPIGNQLAVQLVAAFRDIHSAVLPRLGLALPADILRTAQAHGDTLAVAQAGDVEACRAAATRALSRCQACFGRGSNAAGKKRQEGQPA